MIKKLPEALDLSNLLTVIHKHIIACAILKHLTINDRSNYHYLK